MTSPKSTARWQELKAKKLNGRAVPEDVEYKKLRMKHNADVLALNEPKRKAELVETIIISSTNSNNIKSVSDDVIQSEIGEEQKPYSQKDIADFVNVFSAKARQEVTI